MKIISSKQELPPYLLKFAKITMIGSILVILLSVTIGAYILVSQNTLPASAIHPARSAVHTRKPLVTAGTYSDQVTTLGSQYMNALLQKNYDAMWLLLDPDMQSMWPDKASFTNYWQTRFQGFTLQGFTLGKVSDLTYWVNPETMHIYNNVEMMPISLKLTPNVTTDKLALLPMLDQNPTQVFQNLPLIAERASLEAGNGEGNQWQILAGGPADLEAPILPPITPINKTIKVPILMYHYISEAPNKQDVLRVSLSIPPVAFSEQLDYLQAQNYHTITFNQLFDALYYNGPLPTKPIILTFDDGYDDAYTGAYPILKAHGYSGMFYIITGKVGWKGQATWDQLREMLANGMQMGSHTITHRNIGAVWQNSPLEAQLELQKSQTDMQTRLGVPIQQFCYPSGEPFRHGSLALQQAVIALLEKNGYVGATTDPPPVGMSQDALHPFVLLRVRIDGRNNLHTFMHSLPV